MFEVRVVGNFSAAHYLRNYRGKCEKIHGHNYTVRVSSQAKSMDEKKGFFVDFVELRRILKEILERLDHRNLNEIKPFDEINPTAENIAKYIFEEFKKRNLNITRVDVYETENQSASYYE